MRRGRRSAGGCSRVDIGVTGSRHLNHAQASDRQIVDLDLAEMHLISVGPQHTQAANGERPDGKRTNGESAESKCAYRYRRGAYRRQFKILPS